MSNFRPHHRLQRSIRLGGTIRPPGVRQLSQRRQLRFSKTSMSQSKIQDQCTRRRKAVGQVSWFLQDYIVPYFHITPFLARRGCNIVNFNPMTHRTENDTKSAHYPVMYLCSRRLCLTRLQVVSKIVDLKSITRALPKRTNQFSLVPQAESKTIPPKVQEGIDHH